MTPCADSAARRCWYSDSSSMPSFSRPTPGVTRNGSMKSAIRLVMSSGVVASFDQGRPQPGGAIPIRQTTVTRAPDRGRIGHEWRYCVSGRGSEPGA
jgi:hypothetical protein